MGRMKPALFLGALLLAAAAPGAVHTQPGARPAPAFPRQPQAASW